MNASNDPREYKADAALREDAMSHDSAPPASKQPFIEPKLTYVAPKLVKHGDVTELTGFFGPFSP
jgi:hypothetical protein